MVGVKVVAQNQLYTVTCVTDLKGKMYNLKMQLRALPNMRLVDALPHTSSREQPPHGLYDHTSHV